MGAERGKKGRYGIINWPAYILKFTIQFFLIQKLAIMEQ